MKIFFIILSLFNFLISGDKLPNVKFKNLENKKITLDAFYNDGPIAINVWNLACEPCKKEMKYLSEFNTKYEDIGFEVVSINIDSPRSMSKVKSFVKSMNYSFTVLSDPRAEFFRKSGGKVMPYLIFVNKDGTIWKRHVGWNSGDEVKLEEEIIEIISINNPQLDTLKKEVMTPEKLDILKKEVMASDTTNLDK